MLLRDRHLVELLPFADKAQLVPDGNGYLNVAARIARAGVQVYAGREIPGGRFKDADIVHVLRPESEVFADAAMASFTHLPITLGHPDEGVSAENYKAEAIGVSTGFPVRDGRFLKITLSIRDRDTVAHIIEAGGMQVSNGYTVDLETIAGTTKDGDAYDAIQRNIRGNHIALVDAARCGPECRIGDAQNIKGGTDCDCASCQIKKGHCMSEKHINKMVDGEEIALSAEAATAVEKLQTMITELQEKIAELNGEIAALTAEQPTSDALDQRVAERVALISAAKSVLGDAVDLANTSDADIQKAVITQKYGAGMVTDADSAALKGMFKIAVKDSSTDPLNHSQFISPFQTPDAAYLARIERLKNNYKGA
jgi:hypothetical protein